MQFFVNVIILIACIIAGVVQWFKYFFLEEPLWETPDFLKDIITEELCYFSIFIWGIVFCVPGVIVLIIRNKRKK